MISRLQARAIGVLERVLLGAAISVVVRVAERCLSKTASRGSAVRRADGTGEKE